VAEPAAGQTFLQVAAVKRPEAELIVEVLKKKGFPAITAPVPNEALYRVLVGPLADSAAVAKAKADLELAGFRSIVRKY
jgi:cell division septation protein DedD